MTKLQQVISDSIAQKVIDPILPALYEAEFYVVCEKTQEGTSIWFVTSPDNRDCAVITISERTEWLEAVFANNPERQNMTFPPIHGKDVVEIALAETMEIYIQFERETFKIPRRYFEYWIRAAEKT